ncbi:MAG: 3'-5' exonuclease, partial [Alphaproteobacteria bacterium]|nr:3'-5' exonuclease [Alphaproteobacteria bacterium]
GWLKPRLQRAIENKDYYAMVLFTWAHRMAFLLLPILAGFLALVYLGRKGLYFYDHLIVAMQFLSFVFLISALAWVLPGPIRGWAILVASIWTPINLFQTLRGAYGSGVAGAVVKTGFLWIATTTVFGLMMIGLMALALAQM